MSALDKRLVHIFITEKKVHLYGSHSRAMKVRARAQRMGARFEFTGNAVRRGDPFRSVKIDNSEMWSCGADERACGVAL